MVNDLKMTFDQWYEKQWNEQNTAPSADEAWDYQQQRIDELTLERDTLQLEIGNLHIYLGKKQGANVSYLVELRAQRYLKSWDLYL